jgi:short subunit dehydrogenase-like uncharacterized protein
MSERPFDIVLFGATGFTGNLVAHALDRRAADAKFTFAIAGRNPSKLEALRRSLKTEKVGLIAADIHDADAMHTMASQARVLLTTVGPYAQHGEACVKACLAAETDYLDITGEPEFVIKMLREVDADARSKGILMVNCCGFDSIPADLGALYTVKRLPENEPKTVKGVVEGRFRASGGTWASAIHAIASPRAGKGGATPRRSTPKKPGARAFPKGLHRDSATGSWALPMPVIDPWMVKRSMKARGDYGPDFTYGQFLGLSSLLKVASLGCKLTLWGVLAKGELTRNWLLKRLPSGDGPNASEREKNHFSVTFTGTTPSARIVTRVSGRDPGYDETSKMFAEAGILTATQRKSLACQSGVSTPAASFGEPLIESLQALGIRFEVVE